MKKQIITLLFTSFLLVGCGSSKTSSQSASKSQQKEEITNVQVTGFETRHTDIQLNYLNSENYLDTTPYDGNLSKSAPNPVHISWDITQFDSRKRVVTVDIYEGKDLSNRVASYASSEKEIDFYNTKVGQDYTVKVYVQGTDIEAEPITFVTEKRGPGNLYIEGVENVRDLGGWGYIKQGMIYRSGRFNEDKSEEVTLNITENGLFEVNEVLKIKTEVDLRRTSVNEVGGITDKSPLGEEVNYVCLPMYYGGNNILTFKGNASKDEYNYDNPAAIRQFFELLANEENYPIDFHCSLGKDRTGCLAYLINGLMGASEEVLMRDYMFTNFSKAGMCKPTDITDRYGQTLNEYEHGDTLQEKIYNYLINEIQLNKDSLDKITRILRVD